MASSSNLFPRIPTQKFQLLTPLASEPCSPISSRRSSVDSQRHSYLVYSSDSSLSSDEGKRDRDLLREGSLTPTQTVTVHMCSTPATPKDATLKVSDSIKFLPSEEVEEEEEEGEGAREEEGGEEGEKEKSTDTESKHTIKNTWRLGLFKKRKK